MMILDDLKNRHDGATAYIVGKGPSLRYLSGAALGKSGPVFGVNQAVLNVEAVAAPDRPVYLVQQGGIVQLAEKLKRATVLIPRSKEKYYASYENRCVFDQERWGETPATLSAEMAIILARHMGCVSFVMLCFDAVMLGDNRLRYPKEWDERIEKQLGKSPRLWVMPRKRGNDHGNSC